jgi:glycosyltransferase involved in cell wall biosynthesis
MRVTVLDIEPIDPPHGGSRLRLKGLYTSLGLAIKATYVGAFHWGGPAFRRLRHGPNLEEITIPFSARHLAAAHLLQAQVGSYSIVDASFLQLSRLTPEYGAHALSAIREADTVIFSHPWAFAALSDAVDADRQLLVYDAHNVEGEIKQALLADSPAGRRIAEEVARLEGELCRRADLVLACSHRDREAFAKNYGIPIGKTRLVPNGVFVEEIKPPTGPRKLRAKLRLGVGIKPVALYIGGHYPPNNAAASFIRDRLAPWCPDVTFAVVGGCANALREPGAPSLPPNLRLAGRVSDAEKLLWLHAADVGINPMYSGSGTNVKMFDFMAAGLPVVSTGLGARGIATTDIVLAEDAQGFVAALRRLAGDRKHRQQLGRRHRAHVQREFDWAMISGDLGTVLTRHQRAKGRLRPFFTVAVPTYDRPERLRRLLQLLTAQQEKDFEVIVVDQSDIPYAGSNFGLDLCVVHSRWRGQCRARNLAAAAALGEVIACIDDDCEPGSGWLLAARSHFADPGVVGVEGRCFSDRLGDPLWRTVDNYGAEGAGYMTCNLFVRSEAFHRLGGFDLAFDEKQFRYDTDFGWRLEPLGKVPFSEDAFVYHPPWARRLKRESLSERNRMFEMDALLLRKHPERYRELFLCEGHWKTGAGFWEPFLRGARRFGVKLPDYIRVAHAEAAAAGGWARGTVP